MNLLVLFSWGARCFLGVQTIGGVKFRTFLLWSSNSPCRTNNVREYFTLSIVFDLIRQCSVLKMHGEILPQSNFMQFRNIF